jgi:hypothetical protein
MLEMRLKSVHILNVVTLSLMGSNDRTPRPTAAV